MTLSYIHKKAREIVKYCGTRDPIRIARELGIHVLYNNDFKLLKGMYKVIDKSRFIILNANLDDDIIKTVCAHEIGHDALHRRKARSRPIHEFMLYDMQTRSEYEANIFAGELLIGDDEILELIQEGYDAAHIAETLGTDINLVLIKADELRKRGYAVRVSERPKSDFLS